MYNYSEAKCVEVLIERIDNFGRGLGYIDGKVCFVPNALPGEVVDVEITHSNKKFIEANVLNYITKSSERLEIKCPFYSSCGGCQFLNMSLDKENEYKTDKVKNLVKRIGGIDEDLVEDCISVNEYNYRNKVTFHVHLNKIGYYEEKTNTLVEIDNCMLLRDEINATIPKLKEIVEHSENNIKEIMVRCANTNSNIMVNFIGEVNNLDGVEDFFDDVFVNDKLVVGNNLISTIGRFEFKVSPKSFFQVNGKMVEVLYNEVLNYCIENKPENVLDLYCGTGTIGIYISDEVNRVLGIDMSTSSINNALDNREINKIKNVEFICSKVEDYIDKIIGKHDLVVVDPPRAGLDKKTVEYLKKISSKAIIYISCDPATMARDLRELSDTYKVTSIKPFNMFPKTYHVESVCVLERK